MASKGKELCFDENLLVNCGDVTYICDYMVYKLLIKPFKDDRRRSRKMNELNLDIQEEDTIENTTLFRTKKSFIVFCKKEHEINVRIPLCKIHNPLCAFLFRLLKLQSLKRHAFESTIFLRHICVWSESRRKFGAHGSC